MSAKRSFRVYDATISEIFIFFFTAGSASSPPAQAGGMAALSSNLTSLWKYVKGMEKQFEGGVHIYTEGGQKATKKGNTVNINLKVKDGSCDDDEGEYNTKAYFLTTIRTKKGTSIHV